MPPLPSHASTRPLRPPSPLRKGASRSRVGLCASCGECRREVVRREGRSGGLSGAKAVGSRCLPSLDCCPALLVWPYPRFASTGGSSAASVWLGSACECGVEGRVEQRVGRGVERRQAKASSSRRRRVRAAGECSPERRLTKPTDANKTQRPTSLQVAPTAAGDRTHATNATTPRPDTHTAEHGTHDTRPSTPSTDPATARSSRRRCTMRPPGGHHNDRCCCLMTAHASAASMLEIDTTRSMNCAAES